MAANAKTILCLPGDGIGPEVMREARRVLDWLAARRKLGFEVSEGLVGGAAIDHDGAPISDATMSRALAADAVMLGAVGGPKWDNLPFAQKPERGLLRLRKELGLFANLRPATVFDALAEASTLKLEVVKGLDIMILRELTGGVYFGEPRGIEKLPNGERRGVNTQVYTTHEIVRIAEVGFELARKRNKKVHSVEKANVMESGVLWREEVQKLHDARYADIELQHMYADNCAMQLVRNPRQFDVIVTDNLFGDLLSDCASMLTGSLGMLPSASLGAADAHGRRKALYEPVHGTAPDIAGRDVANPLATILSLAMMLRWSFDLGAEAEMVERADREDGRRGAEAARPAGGLTRGLDHLLGEGQPAGRILDLDHPQIGIAVDLARDIGVGGLLVDRRGAGAGEPGAAAVGVAHLGKHAEARAHQVLLDQDRAGIVVAVAPDRRHQPAHGAGADGGLHAQPRLEPRRGVGGEHRQIVLADGAFGERGGRPRAAGHGALIRLGLSTVTPAKAGVQAPPGCPPARA